MYKPMTFPCVCCVNIYFYNDIILLSFLWAFAGNEKDPFKSYIVERDSKCSILAVSDENQKQAKILKLLS